jgi:heterokaryon incompatibility protein (HET)
MDEGEKSNQIGRMMKDIYVTAHSVIAWVGLENESDATLIRELQSLSFTSERFSPPLVTSLKSFLQREFWTRVWIIQEIALASKEALTIQCGGQRIAWDEFETGTMAILKKEKSAPDTDRLCDNIESLIHFRSLSIGMRTSNVNILLLPALYKTWTAKASVEHDKIFGLLGLVTDGHRYLTMPSYTDSIEEVCQQLTMGVYRWEKRLDIIPMLARGCSHTTVTNGKSPSWVPQWHALNGDAQKRQLEYLQRVKRYAAAGRSDSSISRENDTLTCAGIQVGNIHVASSSLLPGHDQVSNIPYGPTPNPYFDSQGIFFAIYNCLSISEDNSNYHYRRIFRDKEIAMSEILRIWRSPDYQAGFRDRTQEWINQHRSIRFHDHTLQDWAEWMTHTIRGKRIRASVVPKRHKGLASHVKHNVVPGLARMIEEGMKLITTTLGHIGWACAEAKAGDSVYILKGCSVPVILRPGTDGGLVVVGDAYIQDLMQGEFVSKLPENSWGDVAIH